VTIASLTVFICHVVCVSLSWQALSPVRTTGAQRLLKRKPIFIKKINKIDVNYTFKLIDKINLSPSPRVCQYK